MPYEFDEIIVDDRAVVWRSFGEQETVFIFCDLVRAFAASFTRVKFADGDTEFFDTQACRVVSMLLIIAIFASIARDTTVHSPPVPASATS